jgi:thiol:disulfide interchange protein
MRFIKYITILALAFISLRSVAQIEFPEDKVKWKFTIEQNDKCQATIVAEVTIVEGWEINALNLPKGSFGIATNFNIVPSKEFKLVGKATEPKPILHHDEEADEDLAYHVGKIKFKQKIELLSQKDFKLKINYGYQTCKINSYCLPPFESSFLLNIKACKSEVGSAELNVDGLENKNVASVDNSIHQTTPVVNKKDNSEIQASVAKENNSKNAKNDIKNKSLWKIFILSFLSGLAALLTPCVFPMIPMTVSFFTKRSKTPAAGKRNALFYSLSIIVIFVLLGTAVVAIFGEQALNNLSTNPWFNVIFFALLVVFAVSFMGAFEIRLPSKWVNKVDQASDKGGLMGIFFMALALALVSFSCTGPIVSDLIILSAREGGIAPIVGMFGFSFALALPFGLFAAFPGWMNSLPKSGGWLNTVKVVLGLLELALAFKFLSNADLSLQWHLLEREVFLAIWIAIFGVLALYLLGFILFPHDSNTDRVPVGRAMLGMTVLAFVIYMIPGLWGAPLNLISAFPPPPNYSESPQGLGGSSLAPVQSANIDTHLGPQNIMVFHDYDKAYAYAKEVGKPLFVDFTGHNCVNCRKMEQSVWGQPGVIDYLKNDVVIASLHIDERVDLPKSEQIMVDNGRGGKMKLVTTGDKWFTKELVEFKSTAQPLYVMIGPNGEHLSNGKADYEHHRDPNDFKNWIKSGLKEYRKLHEK